MEADSFFCQLLKQLPQTLFELLGQPGDQARDYHFDSVEIKKSFRIDGLFVPTKPALPVYFVEVQFRRNATFYANLFAKVFLYLEANPSMWDWAAVAIFESRRFEPKRLEAYNDLLLSRRVTRIYLDEFQVPIDPPLGLGILQLVSAPIADVKRLVETLVKKAEGNKVGAELGRKVIELTEELLLRRFTELDREEVRKMFQLHDLRKSKVWQDARQEGINEGIEKGIEKGKSIEKRVTIRRCLAKGMSIKETADFMEIPEQEVRRLAKKKDT
jgi:predicted transposase/invertase (TIGR01784 family)